MNDNNLIRELSLLVSYTMEGDISEQQFSRLQDILKESKLAREYYYRLMATHASLCDTNNIILLRNQKERAADFELLSQMLSIENNSPSIEVPKPQEPVLKVMETDSTKESKKNKESVFHRIKVLVSVAAVLVLSFMMLHTFLQPVEIATVTKSLNTALSTGDELVDGLRIIKSDSVFRLKRGLLELTYDCDARLVIEAPATFSLVSGNSLKLDSGSIYLEALSKEARGFTVITPNSEIVDLGTEFGVKVDQNGISELHMTKGRASLRSKVHQKSPVSQILTAGTAGKVDYTGKIKAINAHAKEFARSFDQSSGIVWRGQDICLADLISGGNGLGDGKKLAALDPLSGKIIPWELGAERLGRRDFVQVNDSKFIDGVFVPDGEDGPVIISSQDHTWICPDTSGSIKFNIASSIRVLDDITGLPIGNKCSDLMLTQAVQGIKPYHLAVPEALKGQDEIGLSSIFIHSNLGITYDLDELRGLLPDLKLTKFSSTFGLVEKYMYLEGVTTTDMQLDIWVLVDGKVKYSDKSVNATKLLDIDIPLDSSDKFLSLVVTQGQDGYGFDWGLFYNPVIKLEKVD